MLLKDWSASIRTVIRVVSTNQFTPWGVLLLSLLMTLLAYQITLAEIDSKVEQRFSLQSQDIAKAIKQRLAAYQLAIRSGRGVFDASDDVSRDEWKSFVNNLRLDQLPGIQGLGYALWIPEDQLASHVVEMRRDFPDYNLRPAGDRDVYTSIVYLEPFDWRNQRAFGFDMFSEQTRRLAMQTAMDSDAVAMSGRVVLVQETEAKPQYGFLVYLPVYKSGLPISTVAERRAAIQGFVYAPFRMHDFMDGVLTSYQQGIDIAIYVGSEVDSEQLLYETSDSIVSPNMQHLNTHVVKKTLIHQADYTWTLVTATTDAYLATVDRSPATIVLVAGLLINVLLFLITFGLTQQRRRLLLVNHSLDEARQQATQANNAKSRFLATMSHEIRTPLHGIIASVDLLARSPLVKEQQELTSTVNQSAHNLLAIINNILDFSKIESGKFELHNQAFNIEALIIHLEDLMQPLATQRKVQLEIQFVKNHQFWLFGDGLRLQQVLTNLISNAIKFSSGNSYQGLVAVSITLNHIDEHRYELFVSVRDNGIGMTEAQVARLFKPFEQVQQDTTHKYGGTGLGLVICRDLTHMMGGSISVESKPGFGSQFNVRIPFDAISGPSSELIGNASAKTHPNYKDVWILIAEDDEVNQTVISKQLDLLKYRFTVVNNGQEALDACQRTRFDLIITDLNMPIMGGEAFAHAIRQQQRSAEIAMAPIVLLTANAQLSSVDKSLFDDFLIKPLTLDGLASVIYKWLDEQTVLFNESSKMQVTVVRERIDLTVLTSMVGDKKSDLDNFLRTFERKLREYVEQLMTIKQNQDEKALQSLLHKLKSSARTFGSHELAQLSEVVELNIIEQRSMDISTVLHQIEQEISMVLAAIQELLHKE